MWELESTILDLQAIVHSGFSLMAAIKPGTNIGYGMSRDWAISYSIVNSLSAR